RAGEFPVTIGRPVGDDQGIHVRHGLQVVDERAHEARDGLVEIGAHRRDRVETLLSQAPQSLDLRALAHPVSILRRPLAQTVQVLSWKALFRQAVRAESSTSSGLKAVTPGI